MRPVAPCRVTQKFANPGRYASRTDRHGRAGHHTGTDYGSAWPIPINGRPVRAILGGEVVISEFNSTMGNWVGIYNHDHDLLVTYWHMSKRRVKVGDWVQAYHYIGNVGSTGNSTAPHMHLQVNHGRSFSYHGHISTWWAVRLISRRKARAAYRRNPVHPRQR